MRGKLAALVLVVPFTAVMLMPLAGSRLLAQRTAPFAAAPGSFDETIGVHEAALMDTGRQIFRFDTFGDERFWSDTLKLHQAIGGARLGGVGGGVSPATALAVGLKLDVDKIPRSGCRRSRTNRSISTTRQIPLR